MWCSSGQEEENARFAHVVRECDGLGEEQVERNVRILVRMHIRQIQHTFTFLHGRLPK